MNCQSDFSHLSEALESIEAKKKGLYLPPFVPREVCVSFAKQCQLACVWQMAGEEKAAAQLAGRLLQFAWENPPFSLWCLEEEYDEDEGFFSLGWLCRVTGNQQKAESYFKRVKGPIDPFLVDLASQDLFIQPQKAEEKKELVLFGREAAFTLSGKGTTLGVIRKGDVEIRAMGPQILPLNGAKGFGIGFGDKFWISCQANLEVWMEAKVQATQVDLKFIGVNPEEPMGFALYVKADSCQIGKEILKPKSLQRFQGVASLLQLQRGASWITLEIPHPHKLQIIPLAGDGCYWNSEFLILFEIHPLNANFGFLIK